MIEQVIHRCRVTQNRIIISQSESITKKATLWISANLYSWWFTWALRHSCCVTELLRRLLLNNTTLKFIITLTEWECDDKISLLKINELRMMRCRISSCMMMRSIGKNLLYFHARHSTVWPDSFARPEERCLQNRQRISNMFINVSLLSKINEVSCKTKQTAQACNFTVCWISWRTQDLFSLFTVVCVSCSLWLMISMYCCQLTLFLLRSS